MSQLEELGFGSYAEEATPVTLGEYIGMVGDMGRGTASGVVGMPYTVARGLDDIFDIMLEQGVENDASIVQNLEPLRDLAGAIQGDSEVAELSRGLIGENIGVIGGPATGINMARTVGEYMLPNIAYDEAIRRGMSEKDATAVSLATSAAFGLGRGQVSPTRTDVIGPRKDQGPLGDSDRIATRFPTAKASAENPVLDNLIIDTHAMADAPKAFEKNMQLIKETNLPISARRPDKIAQSAHDQVVDNLLFLHDQTPEGMRNQGKLWYEGANKLVTDIADRHGLPTRAVAGVAAALSPQKDWYQNVSLAERLTDIVMNKAKDGVTPEMRAKVGDVFGDAKYKDDVKAMMEKPYDELTDRQKAMFVRTYDEAHHGRGHRIVSPSGELMDFATKADGTEKGTGWGSLTEIGKAVSVIENPSMENISRQMGGQHKVRNFYNNIIEPNAEFGDVTIDTHAIAAGLLEPFSGKSLPVAHNFGTGSASSALTGAKGTYGLFADAYREAGRQAGVLPREMQSITWENVRGLYSPQFKTKENVAAIDKIQNDYMRGRITQDQARNMILEFAGGITPPSWYRPDVDVRNVKSSASSTYRPSILENIGE